MNRRRTSWRSRAGVTLIEVLAALGLLGTLAVAMVLALGRLVDQHDYAEQKLLAVRAADQLLVQWWDAEVPAVPIDQSGDLDAHPGWLWETQAIDNRELRPFGGRIVRLRILDQNAVGEPRELTSVDLVVPQGDGR